MGVPISEYVGASNVETRKNIYPQNLNIYITMYISYNLKLPYGVYSGEWDNHDNDFYFYPTVPQNYIHKICEMYIPSIMHT